MVPPTELLPPPAELLPPPAEFLPPPAEFCRKHAVSLGVDEDKLDETRVET